MRRKAQTTRTTIFVQLSSSTWPTIEDQPCNCLVTTAYLCWRPWLRFPESISHQILQHTRNRRTWILSTHSGAVSVVPAGKPSSVAFNTLIAVTGATSSTQQKSRLSLPIWSQHQANISSCPGNLTERLIHPNRDNTLGLVVVDLAEIARSSVDYIEAQIGCP
jgi:hypothetical protein